MPLLNENIQNQVRQMLEKMESPVKLVMFTQGEGVALECEMCADTRQLITEIAELSPKLKAEVHDFIADSALVNTYKIGKIPAIAVVQDGPQAKDSGVRLFGIPAGYEFGSLIEDILLVSQGKPDLNPQTLKQLARLDKPVHIQVYVTPT